MKKICKNCKMFTLFTDKNGHCFLKNKEKSINQSCKDFTKDDGFYF